MNAKSKPISKSFKATLERIPSKLNWVIIRIPFDVAKVWGTRAKVRVKGEINGFPLRASVFPTSKCYQCMLIKKSLQTGGWICYWIVNVKSREARLRRAEQVAEQLFSTMEAELDLPPILKLAFARDPRAYQGWQSMTVLQRRHYLLGIFYCRTPESRDRRISKMLEDALARLEGKPRTKAARLDATHEELW